MIGEDFPRSAEGGVSSYVHTAGLLHREPPLEQTSTTEVLQGSSSGAMIHIFSGPHFNRAGGIRECERTPHALASTA